MIIGHKTIIEAVDELRNWLQEKGPEIDEAYQKADYDLNISISIKFGTDKYGKHLRRVKAKFPTGHEEFLSDRPVDEAQQGLPGM